MNYKKKYDIGYRDAPVIFIQNRLIVGDFYDTHTTLLHKELETKDTRFDDLDNVVLFGHLVGSKIYWEWFSNKKLLNKATRNGKYKHKVLVKE